MGLTILRLWRSHRLLFIAFLVALSLTGFFLFRTVVFTVYWSDPARYEQSIEGWMPVRYVARSWDVPPEVLAQALGADAGERRRLTIAEIAAEQGTSIEEVAATLRAAIARHRAGVDD